MPEEARLEKHEAGTAPVGDGWYVLHASEATWLRSDRFGTICNFEGPRRLFSQIGINIRVIEPGRPASLYHGETNQEDFFVLSGECNLIVEEKEIRLRAGHFVHCPPGTLHVFVGAGDGPCADPDDRRPHPRQETALSGQSGGRPARRLRGGGDDRTEGSLRTDPRVPRAGAPDLASSLIPRSRVGSGIPREGRFRLRRGCGRPSPAGSSGGTVATPADGPCAAWHRDARRSALRSGRHPGSAT